MRTCTIGIRGNQTLDIFADRKTEGFEVWTVGSVSGIRTVLNHFITHDNWEARLHYAKPDDLSWSDAPPSDIPSVKHAVALEDEQVIERGRFRDYDNLIYTVAGNLNTITVDRKTFNIAKKAIHGRWTDGVASVAFEENSKLELRLPENRKHPFELCMRVHGMEPNWWSFGSWTLHLMHMSDGKKCGQRTSVVHVDARELHVYSNEPDRLAHIFSREES